MCKRSYNVDTERQQSAEFPSILTGYLGFTGDKKKVASKISLQTLGRKDDKKRHPDLKVLFEVIPPPYFPSFVMIHDSDIKAEKVFHLRVLGEGRK
ncbi:hypothetical protein TNIN_143201 [Trichonephila inaurata madagascariensis]|uniref:Uncharacterized protein n=1 Tax=Trichonephila inaurata madagascariensis TaxID=2747483 RepID=A0A8X7BTC6_9ARAC|nr:hypothetical protein TNIN_143201 [Trichonephila inaurata madagascariensis]